jgi:hypothetical protein
MNESKLQTYIKSPSIFSGTNLSVLRMLGRTTQAFPSGLIRVDQDFVVGNDSLKLARERFNIGNRLYDAGPDAEVDLFIFPDPKESKTIPGFTIFSITAYGVARATEFREVINQQIVAISKSYSQTLESEESPPDVYSWTISEKYLVDSATITAVARASTLNVLGTQSQLRFRLINRRISGRVIPGGADQISISWKKETASITQRNFGRWIEYDHTETLFPYY